MAQHDSASSGVGKAVILCACVLTESTNTSQVVQIKLKLVPLSIKSLNIWEIPFTQGENTEGNVAWDS